MYSCMAAPVWYACSIGYIDGDITGPSLYKILHRALYVCRDDALQRLGCISSSLYVLLFKFT